MSRNSLGDKLSHESVTVGSLVATIRTSKAVSLYLGYARACNLLLSFCLLTFKSIFEPPV